MIVDVIFEESDASFDVDFGEVHDISDGGYERGYADGAKVEYDRFWDAFQNSGNKLLYRGLFEGEGWNNTTFKPKYDMRPTNAEGMIQSTRISGDFVELLENLGVVLDTSDCVQLNYAFQKNPEITRFGVIDFRKAGNYTQQAFMSDTKLKTIDKVILSDNPEHTFSYYLMFQSCPALENITIEGLFTRNTTFQWCPLTVESMKSVISHLKNYSGTGKEFTYEIKFKEECWAALEADSKAPNGSTWKEYVQDVLCWNI